MRTVILSLLVAVVAALVVPSCQDAHAEDKEEIRRVYAMIDTCNDQSRGKEVLELFTAETFDGYERIIKVALDARMEEVKALRPSDKLEVFRIRARAKRAEIEGLDGRGYCEFATSRGWYVRPPAERFESELRNFVFQGDVATAELLMDGEKTGARMRFVRQGGKWRFDEVDAYHHWDRWWREESQESGLSVEELLIGQIEDEIGREAPDSIRKPMPKRR